MISNLLFEFIVDKPTSTVFINREFAAELSLVWDAFTKQEILDQWWAPKPLESRTKFMDFKVGGRRFYAMVSPEGNKFWSMQDFTYIKPKENFKFFGVFSDENENINNDLASSEWDFHFFELNGTTTVKITIKLKTLADIEQYIQMGFKESMTMILDELEKLLQR